MRNMFGPFAAVMVSLALAGCVAGQSLETAYEAPAAGDAVAPASGIAVGLSVTDDRPYVKSGDKPPYYLGKYRAGFGNPWDVTTDNDEPLADIVQRDLAKDLTAMGFVVTDAEATDRQLGVSIRDWNFDGYQNGKLWYDLLVTVRGSGEAVLASSVVSDKIEIKGSFWEGAKGGFEREMPRIYPQVIRKIARDNDMINAALRNKPDTQ